MIYKRCTDFRVGFGEFTTTTAFRNATTRACDSSATTSAGLACETGNPPAEYSDLYLTSTLIQEVMDDMPAFSDFWGRASNPGKLASSVPGGREISYSATKGEWQMVHPPQVTCYLKVWIEQVFYPLPTADATVTDIIYEWDAPSPVCIADATKSASDDANEIYGPVNEVAVPDAYGNISVRIARWSVVSGYEPDISDPDNPQPNGYPDPTWEAAAP